MRSLALSLLALAGALASPAMARKADETPRTVVMTAFPPEWAALVPAVERPRTHHINGLTLLTGTMAGKPVLLMQSGVSVGNAAEPAKRHYSLGVDPALLDLARKVAPAVTLQQCVSGHGSTTTPGNCLSHSPKIVVGGTGVSAGVFADNAEFRDYLASAWKARVLDMESAAVIQVAYANGTPAIVFRSLSDLAGGDAGANQMNAFMALASVNSAQVVRAFVAALPN